MTKKIAWFASFGIAVTVTLGMPLLNFDWLATLVTAAVACAALQRILQSETHG
jgi:hypothetical protein